MKKVLWVAQEVGGVGKSTLTRGLAEAVADLSIIEIETSHRLTEYGLAPDMNEPGVRFFPMRANRAEIEMTGGRAALAELDPVVDALYKIEVPHVADVGANTASSALDLIGQHAEALRGEGIQIGLLVLLVNDPTALASAAKLLFSANNWADATFAVVNEVRGPVDADLLAPVAKGARVTSLKKFDLEPSTQSVLAGTKLRGIPELDRKALARDFGPSAGLRILRDLAAFRLSVMRAAQPAATWLVE